MGFHRTAGGFTVRRKLAAVCVAYLAGIGLAGIFCAPAEGIALLCALFVGLGLFCRTRRRSAFVWLLALACAVGHGYASHALNIRDTATAPGVHVTGTVIRKVSDTRVYLDDVLVDGETALKRPAVVSLMYAEGEETQEVRIGQRISGTGRLFEQDSVRNPGGIDWRISALCDGYDLSGYLLPGWQAEGAGRFSIREAFRLANESLCARTAVLFGEEAPLFQAIMLGSRSQMESGLVQAMRLSGIAHLLVVSGMHLSLVAHALRLLLRRLPLGKRGRFSCQAVLLGAFCLLTGGAAGTVRAYIMTLLRELAPMVGRRYDAITGLAAAALIMTAVNPIWALSASFQFSFFVVLGILLLAGRRSVKEKRHSGRRVLQPLWLSLSAQIAALPMQLRLYGYVPLLALPMNVLCGALMPILLLGGWGTMLISLLSVELGMGLASVISLPARMMEGLSLAVSACDWGILRLPAPYAAALVLYALLMAAFSRQICIRRGRRRGALLLAFALGFLYLPRLDGSARYVQLDVGQGDGALLRQGRQAVLVDVGPDSEYAMLRYLRYEGLFVDAVILSHLDEDHAGALPALLDSEVRIERIVMPEGAQEEQVSTVVMQSLAAAQESGVIIEEVSAGTCIAAGGFALSVLSPHEGLKGSNERSLVLAGDIGGMKLLTLGDLPATCEMEKVPACDILKVAHHGSRYATSASLIEAASPGIALISVGRNSYGHPTQRVLDDLKQAGAQIYRTDEAGCITIWPESGRVQTFIR